MPGTEQGIRIYTRYAAGQGRSITGQVHRRINKDIGSGILAAGKADNYAMQTTIIVSKNNDGDVLKYSIADKDDDYGDYGHDCEIIRNNYEGRPNKMASVYTLKTEVLKITLEASFLTLPKSARRDNTRSVTPTPPEVS